MSDIIGHNQASVVFSEHGRWTAVCIACLLRKYSFVNTFQSIPQTHYGEHSSNPIKSLFFNVAAEHTVNILAGSFYISSLEQIHCEID